MKQVIVKIIDTTTNKLVRDFSSEDIFETEENQAAKASILLNYEGADDKYGNLMTSSLTFDLLVSDARDGKFYHLYTGSETKYKVELWTNENQLLWQGFLMPDQYSEPYKNGCFFVSMTATDGVGLLRGKEFEGSYYEKENSVIKYITTALRETGLNQELYFAPAIEATNGFRWDEIYVSGKLYREEPKKSDVEFLPSSSMDNVYDVLERLVHDLGCRLFTYDNKWFLIGYNQQHRSSIEFFHYDVNGGYKGRVKQEVSSKKVTFYMNPNITVVSPWKTVVVSADLDEDNTLVDEEYYKHEGTLFSSDPSKYWRIVGGADIGWTPRDGKWIATWTHQGQLIPDFKASTPTLLGATNFRTEDNVVGSYLELKDRIWIEKSDNMFVLKYFEFELELLSESGLSEKDNYENNEYANVLRYELLLNNEVLRSNFPNSPNYLEDALELDYNDNSYEYKEEVHKNKNFIEKRRNLSGKIKIDKLNIAKSGWLQLRIYPPVIKNSKRPEFHTTAIKKLLIKLIAKKDYEAKRVRQIDYTTKKDVELFHIDNAQDNTHKRFIFKRDGIVEDKSWRTSWKRFGVNESKRYGDAYACMIHDLQPVPHIKIDGDAKGILPPTMLYDFRWMEDKRFIPVRLELNFSEAKTAITMIENVYEEFFKTGGIFG